MPTSTMLRIVAILAVAMNVASAHHPFSAHYDETKTGTLTGTIAAVRWSNPHVVLALDVANAGGKTERWMIEGRSPNALQRQGWDRSMLRQGEHIAISGWHARDASLMIFSGGEVTFADGSKRTFGVGREICGSANPAIVPPRVGFLRSIKSAPYAAMIAAGLQYLPPLS